MAAEVTKAVILPVALAGELESAAAASDRSVSAEMRVAVKAHLATVEVEATETASGFSRDAAEELGVVFVADRPGSVLAEFRRDGSSMAWGPGPLVKVLRGVEDWHKTRLSIGAADPKPMAIEVRS